METRTVLQRVKTLGQTDVHMGVKLLGGGIKNKRPMGHKAHKNSSFKLAITCFLDWHDDSLHVRF